MRRPTLATRTTFARTLLGPMTAGLVIALLGGCYGPTAAPEGSENLATRTAAQSTSGGQVPASSKATPEAGSESESQKSSESQAERPLDLGDIRFAVPEGWVRQQPRVQIILAEFTLPRTEGDEVDARLTVSSAGGSVEANIERWRGQFGDQPENESVETIELAGLEVTLVDLSGTYNDQLGPFAPPDPKPGYRMLGAIIPIPGENQYFVKCYGPQRTVAAHAEEFHAFVRSLKRP